MIKLFQGFREEMNGVFFLVVFVILITLYMVIRIEFMFAKVNKTNAQIQEIYTFWNLPVNMTSEVIYQRDLEEMVKIVEESNKKIKDKRRNK